MNGIKSFTNIPKALSRKKHRSCNFQSIEQSSTGKLIHPLYVCNFGRKRMQIDCLCMCHVCVCFTEKITIATMACGHSVVLEGICCKCGSGDVMRNNLIPFDFLAKGLKLSPQYVGHMKRHAMRNTLQEKKKLHLVLNLYGTLYDYGRISCFSDREKHLTGEVDSRDDLWRITARSHAGLIKLRPFVTEFLREANKLFTLHAYSLSPSDHSDYMLKLLDPDQTYFGRRVICRRDTWMKTLDLVLVDERVLVILDDQCATWWPDHTNHLLHIMGYRYFKRPRASGLFANLLNFLKRYLLGHELPPRSYSEAGTDESAEDGGLANALRFLTNLHQRFFHGTRQDVRTLLHA